MDMRQAITDQIIAIMESGAEQWEKSWKDSAAKGLPRNGSTGEPYNGMNFFVLSIVGARRGYSTNIWLTYKQAEALGGQVRKGEKGTMGVFFQMMQKKKDAAAPVGEEPGMYPFMKPFWVFNAAQIDGLPADASLCGGAGQRDPLDAAQTILTASGAVIRHGFNRPMFQPGVDEVRMPDPSEFHTRNDYYATAFHELTHWTGGSSRLARDLTGSMGDAKYALEELVAELGSAYLCGHVGIVDATVSGHASYLDHWVKVLKSDKTAIFTASRAASQAYDYLLTKAGMKTSRATTEGQEAKP